MENSKLASEKLSEKVDFAINTACSRDVAFVYSKKRGWSIFNRFSNTCHMIHTGRHLRAPSRFFSYRLNFRRFNGSNDAVPRGAKRKGTGTKSPRNGLLIEQLSNAPCAEKSSSSPSVVAIAVIC